MVDTRERDLSVFAGSKVLRMNQKEFADAYNIDTFSQSFITKGSTGIDYYENGDFIANESTEIKEVVDTSGAGATVTAVLIYCMIKKINDPSEIMKLANKAAGIVINKVGAVPITYSELFHA